jgi:hypothetical protein
MSDACNMKLALQGRAPEQRSVSAVINVSRSRFYMRSGKFLLVMALGCIAVAVLVCVLWYTSAEHTETAKPGTTEGAAAAAGAKVLPTEPKLRVEPK